MARSRTAVAALGAVLLLGVTACEGAGPGRVTNKIYQESGSRYLLEVQQDDGTRVKVRVTAVEWDRCFPGALYPDCKRPPKNPSLRKV